jgi:CheY-specific phosphatase CheX
MDVGLVNPFIIATKNIFTVMAGIDAAVVGTRAVCVLAHDPALVNAVVELRGDRAAVCGAVVLRFPPGAMFTIATAFTQTSVTLEDAHDAIGELANMVAGNANRDLKSRQVSVSVPEILAGDLSAGRLSRLSPWLMVCFTSSAGMFYLCASVDASLV